MSDDLFAPPSKPRSSRFILILVLALVASGAANYWLWQERQRAITDGKSAIAKLAAAEATARDVTQRIQEMQGESIALAEKKPPSPARDARDAGIAASEAAKKAEPDAATSKEPAAKPEAKAKATDLEDEDEDKHENKAKAKPEPQATEEGKGASQPEKKAAKPAKAAKPTKSTKHAKAAHSAKAAKPAPPPRKKSTKPETPSPDREL